MNSANVPCVGKKRKTVYKPSDFWASLKPVPFFFLQKSRNGPKPGSAMLMNFTISKGLNRWRFESKLREVVVGNV